MTNNLFGGPSPFYGVPRDQTAELGPEVVPASTGPQNARESAREVLASRRDLEDAYERLDALSHRLYASQQDGWPEVESIRDLIYRNLP